MTSFSSVIEMSMKRRVMRLLRQGLGKPVGDQVATEGHVVRAYMLDATFAGRENLELGF